MPFGILFGVLFFPFLEASFSAALVFNDVFKDEFTDLAKGTDGFRFPDPYYIDLLQSPLTGDGTILYISNNQPRL